MPDNRIKTLLQFFRVLATVVTLLLTLVGTALAYDKDMADKEFQQKVVELLQQSND